MARITAVFKDYKHTSVPATRKNGRPKSAWTIVEVEDELLPIIVTFDRHNVTYYMRKSELDYANNQSRTNASLYLYHKDGSIAYGNWRHGRHGSKIHKDALRIWWQTKKLIVQDIYQNGRAKDSYKYLLSLIVKDDNSGTK